MSLTFRSTQFFIACAVVVWLVVAVFKLTNLPVPHPSIWPNDAKTRVAYVFAWIGELSSRLRN